MAWTWIALGVSVATLAAPWFWLADLLANFRVYYFFFLAPSAAGLFGVGRYGVATLAACCAIFHLCFLLPYWGKAPAQVLGREPILKVASVNVLHSNSEHQKVLEEILREDPDVIFFMEINEEWRTKLAFLHKKWPYRMERPGTGFFEVMFFSKIPLQQGRIGIMGEEGMRSMEARLAWNGKEITIFGLHSYPPVREEGTRMRDEQLMKAGEVIAGTRGPVVVVGDFNATPWSNAFTGFTRRTGLRDAALGFGVHATWKGGLVWIPIDHILVGKGMGVRDFRVGGDIGSDHYPIYVELGWVGCGEGTADTAAPTRARGKSDGIQ